MYPEMYSFILFFIFYNADIGIDISSQQTILKMHLDASGYPL